MKQPRWVYGSYYLGITKIGQVWRDAGSDHALFYVPGKGVMIADFDSDTQARQWVESQYELYYIKGVTDVTE